MLLVGETKHRLFHELTPTVRIENSRQVSMLSLLDVLRSQVDSLVSPDNVCTFILQFADDSDDEAIARTRQCNGRMLGTLLKSVSSNGLWLLPCQNWQMYQCNANVLCCEHPYRVLMRHLRSTRILKLLRLHKICKSTGRSYDNTWYYGFDSECCALNT